MKRLLVCLLLLGSAGLVHAQSVTMSDLEEHDGVFYLAGDATPYTGAVEEPGMLKGRMEAGRRVGPWTMWNNGARGVDTYEAGQRVRHQMWHANGEPRMEIPFQDGRPHGIWTEWNAAGHKIAERTYVNGQVHGLRRVWDQEGHLLLEAEYVEGQRHGQTTWFYANGQKRLATMYAHGQRHGPSMQWRENGALIGEATWAEGQRTAYN